MQYSQRALADDKLQELRWNSIDTTFHTERDDLAYCVRRCVACDGYAMLLCLRTYITGLGVLVHDLGNFFHML